MALSKHYTWCRDNGQGAKYELMQEESKAGVVVESTFLLHADDLKLDLPGVESKYGPGAHKFFDQQTWPAEEYSFAPDTQITFTQGHNQFRVTRITVHYKGAGLPTVADADMIAAHLYRKNRAMAATQKATPPQAITLLREHLSEHPEDFEAQVALANSYKANCELNQAMAQFTLTLGQAQAVNDQATVQLCLKGLQELRLAPSVPADTQLQKHEVKLLKNGQRFHIGDLAKKPDPNQPGAPGNSVSGNLPAGTTGMSGPDNPLNINFLDPPPFNPLLGGSQAPSLGPDFRIPPPITGRGHDPQSLLNKPGSILAPAGSLEGAPPGTPPGEPF